MADPPRDSTQFHGVVVHESGRRWSDSLSGSVLGPTIKLRHSVTAPETLEIVRHDLWCTLIVELGSNPLTGLELLAQVQSLPNRIVSVVIMRTDQTPLELFAREFGAVAALYEPITGSELARVLRPIVRLQRARNQEALDQTGFG